MFSRSLLARAVRLAVLALGASVAGVVPAQVAQAFTAGQATPLPGFRIQSSAVATDSGAAISSQSYQANGWYPAGPRSTVLAALIDNGEYADTFYSTNMRNIPPGRFTVPWWYRADFTLSSETGLRTVLDFSGVLAKADVFVNGTPGMSST